MPALLAVLLILGGPAASWATEPTPAESPPSASPTPTPTPTPGPVPATAPASVLVPATEEKPAPALTGLLEDRVVGPLVASDEAGGISAGDVTFTADGSRAAYVIRDQDRFAVVLLEKQTPLQDEFFTEVGAPVFSPDGAQLAYLASRTLTGRRRGLVSVGNGLGQAYTHDAPEAGEKPRQSFLVVAQRPDPAADLLVWRIFSPAGTAAGYLADRGAQKAPAKEFVSLESRLANPKTPVALLGPEIQTIRAETTQWVGPVLFSPNGQRLAFPAKCDDAQFMVYGSVDGSDIGRGPALDEIGQAAFSPDSRSLIYLAKKRRASYLLVNEQLFGPFDAVYPPITFDAAAGAWTANVRLSNALHRVLLPAD